MQKFRTSLRSGTLFESSKLPLNYCFQADYLIIELPSLSADELQHSLGHKFYEPIWAMMHKVKRAMEKIQTLNLEESNLEDAIFEILISIKRGSS